MSLNGSMISQVRFVETVWQRHVFNANFFLLPGANLFGYWHHIDGMVV